MPKRTKLRKEKRPEPRKGKSDTYHGLRNSELTVTVLFYSLVSKFRWYLLQDCDILIFYIRKLLVDAKFCLSVDREQWTKWLIKTRLSLC